MPNEKPEPQQIPLEKIHDLPNVPAASLPEKAYGSMVSSILVSGVKEPIILRQREDGEYQLVDGDRRRKSAEIAKLKSVPALVYEMTVQEAEDYRRKGRADPKTPIPGKLAEAKKEQPKDAKPPEKAEEKPAGDGKEKPAEKANAAEAKPAETKPAVSAEEGKKAPAQAEQPKAEKPTEQPAAPSAAKAEPSKTDKAAEQPAAPATDKQEQAPVKKAAEQPVSGKAKAPKKAAVKEETPAGTAADGPTGTVITKVLESRLDPPTVKEKRALPVPGEGEAFSVVLHPAYLKKADINTFSVDRESDDFKELYKSIERFGVNAPVQARVGKDGELEIISGQRRHLIASELNYPVPTIIQQMDDDDARILVADGNLHREHISTYDLSRAVKMKSDAMKRKAGRRSKDDTGPRKIYTDAAIATEMGMSESKLNRLMKLSVATRRVCDLVDENKLPLSVAYNIAFLSQKQQEIVVDLIDINVKVNNDNTQALKKIAEKEPLTEAKIRGILEGTYPPRQVIKPAPVPQAPATPSMGPTNIPASPDVQPAPAPTTSAQETPAQAVSVPAPAQASAAEPYAAPVSPAPNIPAAVVGGEGKKEPVDRENSYETKVVLRGDRLRKYFPDVTMTPREIEDSVYDALEERRQRQERAKSKSDIFKGDKGPVK